MRGEKQSERGREGREGDTKDTNHMIRKSE